MVGHQKKRSSSNELPMFDTSRTGGHISSFSTASSLSRQPLFGRGVQAVQRQPSPPASAYFSGFTGIEEPRATKDADAHFAYSTTLRRHNTEHNFVNGASSSKIQSIGRIVGEESVGLLDRVISHVSGQQSLENRPDDRRANGLGQSEKSARETPSAIHAHSTLEVCLTFAPLYYSTEKVIGCGKPISYLNHRRAFIASGPRSPRDTWLQRVFC